MYAGKRGTSSDLRKLGREEAWQRISQGINNNRETPAGHPGHLKLPVGEKLYRVSKGTGMLLRNAEWKTVGKYSKGSLVAASAAYALYSQDKSIGYNLSGATHAAQKQQRTATGATFATGLGISVATGQYWATAMMLAGRAWQLGQSNRQELYQIKSSQIISSVMKERLVKNTIERRF